MGVSAGFQSLRWALYLRLDPCALRWASYLRLDPRALTPALSAVPHAGKRQDSTPAYGFYSPFDAYDKDKHGVAQPSEDCGDIAQATSLRFSPQ